MVYDCTEDGLKCQGADSRQRSFEPIALSRNRVQTIARAASSCG